MTDITDGEAREVLWASSEEGKAQLAAAWAYARFRGWDLASGLSMADVGALLWAAHEAQPPAEPEPRAKARMRELIEERGEAGLTIRLIAIQLSSEGYTVPREALHRWADEMGRQGLIERGGTVRGSWRMVKR